MQTGRVTYWNIEKGYGFIRQDVGGADQFVHVSGLVGVDELSQGQRVAFEVLFDQRKNKEKAVAVRVIP